MFWIIDRNIKEAPVRCVLNNRTKQKLLAIFNKYVSTNAEEDPDLEEESVKTRVYSDSFSWYQVRDFQANGYILKRINHSVWFRIGINHTNTIESLWHNIKNITDNFSGLSIDSIKKRFNNNEDLITGYLDGWLCYSLLIRDFKRKKLNWSSRRNELCKYLKIN